MSTNNQGGPVAGSGDRLVDALGGSELVAEFGPLSNATEDDELVVRAENSTVDGEGSEGEGEDTLSDSSESGKLAEASKKPEANQKISADKDIITVTDESGRKRKVEIDYSNKEQIRKVYAQAAGMRKFQAERDKEIQSRKGIEQQLQEKAADWTRLEEAFQKGHEHLVDLLSGRQGAFKELVDKEIQRREFMKSATPEELQALQAREQADLTRKELEKLRKDNEDFKKTVQQEREQAEMKSMESRVHPVFEKYRFADKLGDAQDEHMFDEMLWNSALKRLEPYEQQGLDISPELVEREFRNVASAIRKRISVQAEKRVSKVVEQKKQEATENVQAKIKSGYTGSSDQEKLKKAIQSGDTSNIFKNWGTFSKILGNQRR